MKTDSGANKESEKPLNIDSIHLETSDEEKIRWRSNYIIYFTVFLMSLGFSIVLTGVWPYLNKLDPKAEKEFMGFVVAANPLAQMLFSPLVGWWANKLGSTRTPLITMSIIFLLSSAAYSLLELFPSHRAGLMLTTRFLVGVSSADIAVCRSYISAATKLSERTRAVSMISLAQVLGFVVGPAMQAAVTPLGEVGWVLFEGLSINMYTAIGWLNTLMGIFNFILLLPCFFKERSIAAKEAMLLSGAATERDAWKEMKPDYISAWTLIMAFYILTFSFVLLETLGTSLTMDQFAWTRQEALYYMGILLCAGGVIACASFALIGFLCKKFGEVRTLMFGGFLAMVLGMLIQIPWGTPPPLMAAPVDGPNATNLTINVGCPVAQDWCHYTPGMTIQQFLIGFTFISVGYPIGITLIQAIFSKILGPRPQGVWMGMMTGWGCLSRVMGPVFVTQVYTRWGPVWTYSLTTLILLVAMVWLQLVTRRLNNTILSLMKGKTTDSDTRNGNYKQDIELVDPSATDP